MDRSRAIDSVAVNGVLVTAFEVSEMQRLLVTNAQLLTTLCRVATAQGCSCAQGFAAALQQIPGQYLDSSANALVEMK